MHEEAIEHESMRNGRYLSLIKVSRCFCVFNAVVIRSKPECCAAKSIFGDASLVLRTLQPALQHHEIGFGTAKDVVEL